jgi:Tfp pilus assembly protein FimT
MFKRVLIMSLLGLTLGVTSAFAYSPEFEAGIQQARDAAPAAKLQAQQVMKGFNPKEVFEHYEPQPEQAKLYGGITQANTEAMQQKTNEKMADSDIAQTIVTSKNTRPLYQPNLQTVDMQRSLLIQSEADNIIRGVTSRILTVNPNNPVRCNTRQRCVHGRLLPNL